MGKKYIVEIGRLERLYKAYVNGNGKPNLTWLSPEVDLTPYTEPDLEQVRKEAYEKGQKDLRESCVPKDEEAYGFGYNEGFQCGLDLAWEAARKLYEIDFDVLCELFGKVSVRSEVLDMFTAAEAIEKLKAYEQEQETIQVGDEVAFRHDDGRPDTVVVVTYIGEDGFIDGMDGRGTQYAHKNPKRWTKTGRSFPRDRRRP